MPRFDLNGHLGESAYLAPAVGLRAAIGKVVGIELGATLPLLGTIRNDAAFGLRYLMANLAPELAGRAAMLEFDINQRPLDVLEMILAHGPKVVGLGVYTSK